MDDKENILLAYDVNILIKNTLNFILTSVMKEKYGDNWFNKIKQHMIDNENKSNGKYIDSITKKSVDDFDPTITCYLLTGDNQLKEEIKLKDIVINRINLLREARNDITHSLNSGKLESKSLYVALDAVDKTRVTLAKVYGKKWFKEDDNKRIKEEIEILQKRINYAPKYEKVKIDKMHKYNYKYLISILFIVCLFCLGYFFFSLSNTKSNPKNDINNMQNEVVVKGNKDSKDKVLEFANNKIPSQKLNGKFELQLLGIEFKEDKSIVHLNFINKYSGQAIMNTSYLKVNETIQHSDWLDGQLSSKAIEPNSETKIDLEYPTFMYTEGDSIEFYCTLSHFGSLEASPISGKSISIKI